MKTLKFRPNLAEKIISGKKTSTWRLFDDKDLKAGDIVEFLNWETKKPFAEAELVAVEEKTLGRVQEKDFEGHEKFANREEMIATYKKYYGERVDKDSPLKVIKFKLINIL